MLVDFCLFYKLYKLYSVFIFVYNCILYSVIILNDANKLVSVSQSFCMHNVIRQTVPHIVNMWYSLPNDVMHAE